MVAAALADLARSGISADAAEFAGMYTADNATEVEPSLRPLPALVIPYIGPDGAPLLRPDGGEFIRVRYLQEKSPVKSLLKSKDARYGQPARSGVRAYFPKVAGLDWAAVVSDPAKPLVITEGEKKAHAATLAGFPTIGLGGVFNWLSQDALLPELAAIAWESRKVYICFDSDAVKNGSVLAAENRLAQELGLRRKAAVHIVRIPGSDTDDAKVGLDDFLLAGGPVEFRKLLEVAVPLGGVDREIVRLNERVTWVERDGMIFDTRSHLWIDKSNFVKGSVYSTVKTAVTNNKNTEMKIVSIADVWLTSPLAARVDDVVFAPNEPKVVDREGLMSLNLWEGYRAEAGDVTPWLDLTEHLFSLLPENERDFAVKLLAYKAKNPALKIPLSIVLVGPQGCGKSFWAKTVREAFSPYGNAISSTALVSDFNGWIESSLICVIDEAQAVHVAKGGDTLKSLISEQKHYLNEKYRAGRQVDSYTLYIMTANDRRVGSYAQDDRRMFVVGTPAPADKSLYDRCGKWLNDGGARHLMQWLLDYDLKGWQPPKSAPMTAEKYMSYIESLTPVMRLAEDMKTASQNTVRMWLDGAMEWVRSAEIAANTAGRAAEVREVLGRIRVRPFYTPAELMLMFPAIVGQLHGIDKSYWVNTPGDLSRQLRECGIQYLRCLDDPRGFMLHGRIQQFLVIADQDKWTEPVSQADFDAAMATFPEYRNL